jgi:hypothetical protein|tara:strand:+ start:602 stop:859 length:258 start_codon:yes stop_codon:yes gene_type:complete
MEQGSMTNQALWEDEMFEEIQIGDKVFYFNERLQECSGDALMRGPAGWVVSCEHGTVVVNDGENYAGHTPAKNRKPDHLGHFLNG